MAGKGPRRDGSETQRSCTKVEGYFIPDKSTGDENGESESESDDGGDDEFSLDVDRVQSTRCAWKKALIKPLSGDGRNMECRGKFVLTQPWWKLELEAKLTGSSYSLVGAPLYSLRQDAFVAEDNVVFLFINECLEAEGRMNDSFVGEFEKLERALGGPKKLSFSNLQELINSQSPLRKIIEKSAPGHLVFMAMEFPQLFRILSGLLPKHFVSIFGKKDVSMLQQLASAVTKSPWIFAFKEVMKRRFCLPVEATLDAVKKSEIYQEIAKQQKDAICAYSEIKKHSKDGHTFLTKSELKKKPSMKKAGDMDEVVNFLEEENVCKVEGDKIFLMELWEAEEKTAASLSELLQACKHPSYWTLDFSSKEFDAVRHDAGQCRGQCRAVHLMGHSPLVLLSGKGGCGKTTVVTQFIKHVITARHPEVRQYQEWEAQQAARQQHRSPAGAGGREEGTSLQRRQEPPAEAPGNLQTRPSPESGGESAPQPMEGMAADAAAAAGDDAKCQDHEDALPQHYMSKTAAGRTILLTAATGKASQVLGRKARMESFTLHSVIISHRNFIRPARPEAAAAGDSSGGEKGDGDVQRKTWRFAEIEVLVVDEASLVSVQVFQKLLACLMEDAKLCKVILLGDKHQLPSIEPGRLMEDCFEAFHRLGLAVELLTNHRAESELIVQNASRISKQELPLADPDRGFHIVEVKRGTGNDWNEKVKALLKNEEALKDHVTSQFVAFRRKDCLILNELCALHYNKHSLRTNKGRTDFRVGDKVCMGRNGDVVNHPGTVEPSCQPREARTLREELKGNDQSVEEELKKKGVTRLYNGEVFFITDIKESQNQGKKAEYMSLSNEDSEQPRQLVVWSRELKGTCKMRHAWARTIHTYQGSESDTVVYILDGRFPENWQHMYTAVTRGRRAVYVVGDESALEACVGRRRKVRGSTLQSRISQRTASLQEQIRTVADRVARSCQAPAQPRRRLWDLGDSEGDLEAGMSQLLREEFQRPFSSSESALGVPPGPRGVLLSSQEEARLGSDAGVEFGQAGSANSTSPGLVAAAVASDPVPGVWERPGSPTVPAPSTWDFPDSDDSWVLKLPESAWALDDVPSGSPEAQVEAEDGGSPPGAPSPHHHGLDAISAEWAMDSPRPMASGVTMASGERGPGGSGLRQSKEQEEEEEEEEQEEEEGEAARQGSLPTAPASSSLPSSPLKRRLSRPDRGQESPKKLVRVEAVAESPTQPLLYGIRRLNFS